MKKHRVVKNAGPINLAEVHRQLAAVVHELGFVVHHCNEASTAARTRWHAQVAQELSTATTAVCNASEELYQLECYVQERAVAANRVAKQQKPRRCRKCGCTHTKPCVDPRTGQTCHWVEKDLCSACAPKRTRKGRR